MKNSKKFILIFSIIIFTDQRLTAQVIDLFNKNVKFEKISYKKSSLTKYSYSTLEIKNDGTFDFEKK